MQNIMEFEKLTKWISAIFSLNYLLDFFFWYEDNLNLEITAKNINQVN